jgi:hypothetical protein
VKSKRRRRNRPAVESSSENSSREAGLVTEVFYEVHGDRLLTWPMRTDVSDDKVVEEAGCLLWKRAQQRPDDVLLIGAFDAATAHCTPRVWWRCEPKTR